MLLTLKYEEKMINHCFYKNKNYTNIDFKLFLNHNLEIYNYGIVIA